MPDLVCDVCGGPVDQYRRDGPGGKTIPRCTACRVATSACSALHRLATREQVVGPHGEYARKQEAYRLWDLHHWLVDGPFAKERSWLGGRIFHGSWSPAARRWLRRWCGQHGVVPRDLQWRAGWLWRTAWQEDHAEAAWEDLQLGTERISDDVTFIKRLLEVTD